MRTRNCVRNFGEDLTNQQSMSDSIRSKPYRREKNEDMFSRRKNLRDGKIFKRNEDNPREQSIIQERIDEILLFGYGYFEKFFRQTSYIWVLDQSAQGEKFNPQTKVPMFITCPQLTVSMRCILVEWLIQVHRKMGFRYETLFLTIYLIDKFCSKRTVCKSQYQLLAMACLFIAGKYEEVDTPKLRKIMTLCGKLYECKDVLDMESEILLELNFKISQPSLNWFVSSEIFAVSCYNMLQNESPEFQNMTKFARTCYYTLQLCLFEIQLFKKYSPQVISNAILYSISLQRDFMGINVKGSTTYLNPFDLKQTRQCCKSINQIYADRHNRKYEAVNDKYPDFAAPSSYQN